MIALIPAEHWEYNFSDIIRGLATTFGLKKVNRTLYIEGLGNCIPARSARSAIIAAIKSLDLPIGARIGVPLYCCPVVFKAIKVTGCVPRFIDVERETFCISPDDLIKKRSQIDAVIAVHMFGNICDVPRLQEAAEGKPIIEDCAQSLGSKFDDKLAGSFGNIAVFSFRSGKYLSVGEGGALFSNDTEMRDRLDRIISAMPVPSRANELAHIARTYMRSKLRSRPMYGIVGEPLWSFYNSKASYALKSPIVISQTYISDLDLANNRLTFLHSTIKEQRKNAEMYFRMLKVDESMLCFEKPRAFYNRYLYPITFHSYEQRNQMASYLHNEQISTAKPYEDVAVIAATHYGYTGDCPTAEKLLRKVLIIPSYHSLNKEDIERIAQCINARWLNIKV